MADEDDEGSVPLDSYPSRRRLVGWRGTGQCLFCGSPDTLWQHDLDVSRSTFRSMFGKGNVWGGFGVLCDPCQQRYDGGAYGELAQLQTETPPAYENAFADHLIALAAFCRADQGRRALAEPDFPAGFLPRELLTGAEWIFDPWPEAFRMQVHDSRLHVDGDDGVVLELVASPWPSVPLPEVFRLVWGCVDRERDHLQSEESRSARAAEVLRWPEPQALAYLRDLDGESR